MSPTAKTPIKILLMDPDFLVVEKPSGLPTQPLAGDTTDSLASLLNKEFVELESVGGEDGGAVHRLDVETSGLVIFARNQKTYDYFRKAFSTNKIEKEYVARVEGIISKPGKIDTPIGSDPKSKKRVKVYKNKSEAIRNKAQEAVTYYTPLSKKDSTTLVSVKIKTGRRHQIRAHLAFLGFPIVGDKIYGTKQDGERLHLHACFLSFTHPLTKKKIEVRSISPLA